MKSSALAIVVAAATVLAQAPNRGAKGAVEKIKVHGTSLEGNLEGDSPDRDVLVYLVPTLTSGAVALNIPAPSRQRGARLRSTQIQKMIRSWWINMCRVSRSISQSEWT
jgi:hypothetical protein